MDEVRDFLGRAVEYSPSKVFPAPIRGAPVRGGGLGEVGRGAGAGVPEMVRGGSGPRRVYDLEGGRCQSRAPMGPRRTLRIAIGQRKLQRYSPLVQDPHRTFAARPRLSAQRIYRTREQGPDGTAAAGRCCDLHVRGPLRSGPGECTSPTPRLLAPVPAMASPSPTGPPHWVAGAGRAGRAARPPGPPGSEGDMPGLGSPIPPPPRFARLKT